MAKAKEEQGGKGKASIWEIEEAKGLGKRPSREPSKEQATATANAVLPKKDDTLMINADQMKQPDPAAAKAKTAQTAPARK